VQLPLLQGKINNRLYKVLSVFDQKNRDKGNRHFVNLDERNYEGDRDMMYLIRRLTQATANAELREEMKEEDLYFSEIEDRDTTIMEQKGQLEKQKNQLAEQKNQLAAKDSQLLSMAKAMSKNGMSLETIASAMRLPVEEVSRMLEG